jgi:cell division protein FtsQ
VDVSDPEDVKAVVTSGGSDILVHFGDEKFVERFREFEQHLPEWKQQYPKLASADMRYERQVVLEMPPGTGVQAAGGAAAAGGDSVKAGATSVSSKPAHVAAVSQPKPRRRVTAGKATSTGKATSSNARLFARLAAERRAREARARRPGSGGGAMNP